MSEFRGRYPGGPSRQEEGEERPAKPRLTGVGEIEERSARAAGLGAERRRVRRVRLGFLVAILLSGAIGLAVGYMSHTSPSELAAEGEAARRGGSSEVSAEVNRVLMELWRMEEIEAGRNEGSR